jgi:hypothetical protein
MFTPAYGGRKAQGTFTPFFWSAETGVPMTASKYPSRTELLQFMHMFGYEHGVTGRFPAMAKHRADALSIDAVFDAYWSGFEAGVITRAELLEYTAEKYKGI